MAADRARASVGDGVVASVPGLVKNPSRLRTNLGVPRKTADAREGTEQLIRKVNK